MNGESQAQPTLRELAEKVKALTDRVDALAETVATLMDMSGTTTEVLKAIVEEQPYSESLDGPKELGGE